MPPTIDPECDNTHLFGLPAIECLDDRVAPRAGSTPVQQCDFCMTLATDWGDLAAAKAVAKASGGSFEVVTDDLGVLQVFVTPAIGKEALSATARTG